MLLLGIAKLDAGGLSSSLAAAAPHLAQLFIPCSDLIVEKCLNYARLLLSKSLSRDSLIFCSNNNLTIQFLAQSGKTLFKIVLSNLRSSLHLWMLAKITMMNSKTFQENMQSSKKTRFPKDKQYIPRLIRTESFQPRMLQSCLSIPTESQSFYPINESSQSLSVPFHLALLLQSILILTFRISIQSILFG